MYDDVTIVCNSVHHANTRIFAYCTHLRHFRRQSNQTRQSITPSLSLCVKIASSIRMRLIKRTHCNLPLPRFFQSDVYVSLFCARRLPKGANYLQGKFCEFSIQKLSNLLSFAPLFVPEDYQKRTFHLTPREHQLSSLSALCGYVFLFQETKRPDTPIDHTISSEFIRRTASAGSLIWRYTHT